MTDTEEGRVIHELNALNSRYMDEIADLARRLAEARDHAARLDHDLDVVMSERDAAQDALQETHIALGGDGEWVAKIPEEEPPHSGDLHVDTPALAAEVFAAKEKAEARLAEVDDVVASVRDTLVIAAHNPSSHGGLRSLREIMLRQAERLDAALSGKQGGG